jgi:hypothetical protein
MTTVEQFQETLNALTTRLQALEGERGVRNTLARYMTLCDQPCHDLAYPQLGDLFAADAIWEGVGELYTKSFGRQSGRAAIVSLLGTYLAPSTHFQRNLHFLTSDQVTVEAGQASGQWVMLQLSTYENGVTEAISARLNVDFRPGPDGRWLISRFRTQRLSCMPCTAGAGPA